MQFRTEKSVGSQFSETVYCHDGRWDVRELSRRASFRAVWVCDRSVAKPSAGNPCILICEKIRLHHRLSVFQRDCLMTTPTQPKLSFKCVACKRTLSAPATASGKAVSCPCGQKLKVPIART